MSSFDLSGCILGNYQVVKASEFLQKAQDSIRELQTVLDLHTKLLSRYVVDLVLDRNRNKQE